MGTAFSWFLARSYLLARRVNLLGMGGVALSVWALIVVVAVFSGFIKGIRSNIRNATPELLITDLPTESSFEEVYGRVEDDPDVVAGSPRLRHYGLYYPIGRGATRLQRSDEAPLSALAFEYVELVGIDSELESTVVNLRSWLENASRKVEDLDHPLTVSKQQFARARELGNAQPLASDRRRLRTPPGILFGAYRTRASRMIRGQEVSLVSARMDRSDPGKPELRKIRRVFAFSGAFNSGHQVFDQTGGLVDIEQLRTMLGHDAGDPASVDLVTDVALRIRAGADLDTVAARLRDKVGDASVLTWEQQNSLFLGAVDQERGMMKLILFAIAVVSTFLIYATMHMMVTQKIKDIGILSALGSSPRGIKQLFLICGVTIGGVGCTVGALIGCTTAIYLDAIDRYVIRGVVSDVATFVSELVGGGAVQLELFPSQLFDLEQIPIVLEPTWIMQVVCGAFAMTLIAAWLPAHRAARFQPVRALGYE